MDFVGPTLDSCLAKVALLEDILAFHSEGLVGRPSSREVDSASQLDSAMAQSSSSCLTERYLDLAVELRESRAFDWVALRILAKLHPTVAGFDSSSKILETFVVVVVVASFDLTSSREEYVYFLAATVDNFYWRFAWGCLDSAEPQYCCSDTTCCFLVQPKS